MGLGEGFVDPENIRFYEENSEDLRERYRGQTVVILDGDVVESSGDFEDLGRMLDHVEEEYGAEKLEGAYFCSVNDQEQGLITGS